MSIDTGTERAGHPAWQAALVATAVAGTLATACMMPFVAVAVATAATLSRTRAAATIATVWAINQLIGFTLLGYPPTAFTVAWGVALGGATLLAMFVARRMLRDHRSVALVPLAFAAAFMAYEGALFAFALAAGGTGTFTPAIVGAILVNDAVWLAALVALHMVLTGAAPHMFGPRLALRSA